MSTSTPTPSSSTEPLGGAQPRVAPEQRERVTLEDVRASHPVDRLLEDSWQARSQRASRRELLVEAIAATLFLLAAAPLAVPAIAAHHLDAGLALMTVALYAIVAGTIRFPLGAGFVVPTYVILVPMLLLLPPGTVPLLTALALTIASVGRWVAGRATAEHVLFSVPNAWHALGPTAVLLLAGRHHSAPAMAGIYLLAFTAGCLLDLAVSILREAFALAIAPQLQLRVVAMVWMIDACIAPLGLLIAVASRHNHANLLMVLPLSALLLVLDRDRTARIDQAQHRLALVGRERTRLQAAVRRLGDAFAAKLDLDALASIALHGTLEALDADAGQFALYLPDAPPLIEATATEGLSGVLEGAASQALDEGELAERSQDGVHALAVPFASGRAEQGVIVVARRERAFQPDERELMLGLVERANTAVREILAHQVLRVEAVTDALTNLGNRRRLTADLAAVLAHTDPESSDALVLMLFDLDGFKTYNDTFGHPAGDALLTRLGGKLAVAVAPYGTAYRLGGDEFCALLSLPAEQLHDAFVAAAEALHEGGEDFSIRASCGAVLLPHEANTAEYAVQLADERMYADKQRRPSGTRAQTREMLMRIMQVKQPSLGDHSNGVADLAVAVGRRLGMAGERIDELLRAAELHDIGKVGIPDAILEKPGALDGAEWEFMRQHTILGERILSAAPALRPVATIVRASHERWDGRGYPDRLTGEEIPLAARIIAVCDAYDAITSDRSYRKARSFEQARGELLREAGHQFDPAVVDAVLAELEERPEPGDYGGGDLDNHRRHVQEVADRLLGMLR